MERKDAVDILERCFTETIPPAELAEAVAFAISYISKPVDKDQTRKDLEELVLATRNKQRAEYEVQRIGGYRFKTPGMKSDLSRWNIQLQAAIDAINRICTKYN